MPVWLMALFKSLRRFQVLMKVLVPRQPLSRTVLPLNIKLWKLPVLLLAELRAWKKSVIGQNYPQLTLKQLSLTRLEILPVMTQPQQP